LRYQHHGPRKVPVVERRLGHQKHAIGRQVLLRLRRGAQQQQREREPAPHA
jgi:hypothetical protein